MTKSHALNLYDSAENVHFKIAVGAACTTISDPNKVKIASTLELGPHADVGAALSAVQSDLLTNSATASSASNTVQLNLDSYSASNDAALLVEKQRIDAILTGADVSLDSLKELSDAFQIADTGILSTITALQSQISALHSTIASLTAE